MKSQLIIVAILLYSCSNRESQSKISTQPPSVIAFGSCGHQNDPQPVLERVVDVKPDMFIYLGDNIYSDTHSMDTLRMNYSILGKKPEYQKLKNATKILATWDDHDYGWNDSGRHYRFKKESKNIFLDFFGIEDSTVLTHPGI